MNAERYSIEQQENCVSTPESNVSVLSDLEEGNNYFIFISFVHSPQMSNDLIGQGSSRSVLEACSQRSTIQSKTGVDFSQVSETTFWTEVCVYFLNQIQYYDEWTKQMQILKFAFMEPFPNQITASHLQVTSLVLHGNVRTIR